MNFENLNLELGINNALVSEDTKQQVLSEQNNTCQFCGFKTDKFQEVVNYKGNNQVACSFCYQVLNLEAAISRRSGYLIYLPELTQAELNHILRAIYVARTDSNLEIATSARRVFDVLIERRALAEKILGTDDLRSFAEILQCFMNDEEKSQISDKLSGIRLLSLDKKIVVEDGMEFNEFPQMLNFWKSKVDFLNIPCCKWEKLEKAVSDKSKSDIEKEDENIDG